MWRAFLMSIVVIAHCAAQSNTPVPSTFFAVSGVRGNYPQVTVGLLAHQEFAWAAIEQSKGVFNFKVFDNYMANVQLNGLVDPVTNTADIAMTLANGTPSWAVANKTTCTGGSANLVLCTAPPDNIQDWTDFVTAVVQHYNGKTQPHIKYYELWNEINIAEWWTGTNAQMLALAEAAYPIIHADGYSQLLTPSVAGPVGTVSPTSQVNAMTQYLQAGGYKYADGGAFHGYIAAQSGVTPFPMPEQDTTSGCKAFLTCHGSIITIATQMRAVFDQNGLLGKPIFQTEGSWGNLTVTDPDTQVQWIARYNVIEAGLRSTLNLQMAAWFTWADPTFGLGNIADASLNPTAAGTAYNQVYNWVVGSTIAQPCSGAANGTWTCTLTRPGGYTAQAVWNTQGPLTYSPGAGYTQVRDLAGNTAPIAAGGSVTIGTKPVLVESAAGSTPVITLVANAKGEGILIAPNTWIEIKGFDLAPTGHTRTWQTSDFVGNKMPVQLDGVSATVNGKSAYVYYISPTQVNILAPPDAIVDPVAVAVTNNGATSAPASVPSQALSPSFFVINGGPYVAAQHSANYSLVGPTSLYPGDTTPAKPGETVLLYANGFGPVSPAVVSGSSSQIGTITPLPAVTIGGIAATVTYAGINGAPGLFQLNVAVPATAPDGDNLLTATYNGATTQPGVLITVQH
jgi:uncharacterized protein (TIGR03437 family)